MANAFRIARINYVDTAVLSTGSEISSLPIANLKDADIQVIWRSASTASSQLLVLADLGQSRTLGVVALMNCNVFAPATFHVRVSTTDATGIAGDAYNVAGIAGIADAADPAFVHVIDPAVSGRYVRINGNSLTEAPEAGRLMIGELWAPSRDVSIISPPEDDPRDFTEVSYSLGGNPFYDVRPRQRRFRFVLRGLTTAERDAEITTLNRQRGIGREILVIFDKDSSNIGRDSVWGHLTRLVRARRIAGMTDAWTCEFEIEERI